MVMDNSALVARLIDTIGAVEFPDSLLQLMRSRSRVDQIVVFTFSPREGFDCPIVHGDMAGKVANTLSRSYSERYFRLDPNLERIVEQPSVLETFRFDLGRVPSAQYRNLFFERADLCDKFSFVFTRHGLTFYCNFYRLTQTGNFDEHDLGVIESLAPVLASSIGQHSLLINERTGQSREGDAHAPGSATDSLFLELSERENAVCQRIFMGLSNEAISLDLSISVHTVRTYRQRLYKKAAVSSVNELYAKFAGRHRYRVDPASVGPKAGKTGK